MPQTLISRGCAELQQVATAAAAIAAYESTWGYAEKVSAATGRKAAAPAAAAAFAAPELKDMSDRLAELVAAQRAVAAAVAAVESYSAAMGYAEAGRVERRAVSADFNSVLEPADFACRLEELVRQAQAAVALACAATVPDWWAYAEAGRPERCGAGKAVPAACDAADMAERMSELTQRIFHAVPDCWQYAEAGRAERCSTGKATPAPSDAADMAERLAELTQRVFACIPSYWQLAEPGRPQCCGASSATPTPFDQTEMAERLVELTASA
ncbi:hypothetical protein ABPG75_002207 [Micractinium tetrahymenae]